MNPRDRRIDRAFPAESRGIWMATLGVILVGVLIILFVMAPSERRRLRQIDQVQVGDPAERILEVTGGGALRCPPGPLDHLRTSFPEGWPPAAVDVALEQLEAGTAERWVVPIDDGAGSGCAPADGQTELGVDLAGTIVWLMPATGRTSLQLPPWLTPSGVTDDAAPNSDPL